MDTLRQDLKFAFRMLVKDRGFAIDRDHHARPLHRCQQRALHDRPVGAAAAAAVSRFGPPRDHVRLVPRRGCRAGRHVGAELRRSREADGRLRFLSRSINGPATASGRAAASEGVSAMNVTPSFFRVLRAAPVRGRLFTEDDGMPGRNKVAVAQPRVRREAGRRHRRRRRARHPRSTPSPIASSASCPTRSPS